MINLKPTNLELFLPSGKKIKYLLKRRNRRTIGLKVDHDGLVIHAPILIPRSRIEELIAPKLDWIQEKLSLQLSKKKKIYWKTGELIHILGNKVILSLKASMTNSVLQDKDILHVDTNRVNDRAALPGLACSAELAAVIGSPRLLKKLLTPLRTGAGVTAWYPSATGFKTYLSAFWLKENIARFQPSNGSFSASAIARAGIPNRAITK